MVPGGQAVLVILSFHARFMDTAFSSAIRERDYFYWKCFIACISTSIVYIHRVNAQKTLKKKKKNRAEAAALLNQCGAFVLSVSFHLTFTERII